MGSHTIAAAPDLVEDVMRWGWNATAFQLLEPGFRYFSAERATIGYRDVAGVWVAAGAPLGPESALAPAARSFERAARAAGRRVCYAPVEQRFIALAGLRALPIGEQPVWTTARWPSVRTGSASLREQIRRARRKGVVVTALGPEDLARPAVQARLWALAEAWLGTRRMPELGFLVRVELFGHPSLRRVFTAERDGQLVAAAALVPIPARRGWLLEDLLRSPEAPNGTSELLFDTVLETLGAEEPTWVTMGLTPLAGTIPLPLRVLGRLASSLYDFDGLVAFRRRLRPDEWTPQYLAYPDRFGAPRALAATLRAVAGGALSTALIRPPTPAAK